MKNLQVKIIDTYIDKTQEQTNSFLDYLQGQSKEVISVTPSTHCDKLVIIIVWVESYT